MKENKKSEVLLKFIQRLYDKNSGMQEVIDTSMIKACAEEGISPKQVFFILLFFAVVFIIMGTQEKI